MNLEELLKDGWEVGYNQRGQRYFITPLSYGKRKKIHSARYLGEHMHLKNVLFPPNAKGFRQSVRYVFQI